MAEVDPGPSTLLVRFQACQLPHEEWTHRAHLLVAASYLKDAAPGEVLARLRTEIQQLNLFHGVMTTLERGYHETLTRVWLCLVLDCRRQLGPEATAEDVAEACSADTTLPLRYYSKERLMSWQARIGWVPPDREPLPFDPGGWEDGIPPLFTLVKE